MSLPSILSDLNEAVKITALYPIVEVRGIALIEYICDRDFKNNDSNNNVEIDKK